MNILAKFFHLQHNVVLFSFVLLVGLFGAAMAMPQDVSAQACGFSKDGLCKASCDFDTESLIEPRGRSAVCDPVGLMCCKPKNNVGQLCGSQRQSGQCKPSCDLGTEQAISPSVNACRDSTHDCCMAKPPQTTDPEPPRTNGTTGSDRNSTNNTTGATGSDIFGKVEAPQGVDQFTPEGGGIGLLNFISMLIKIFTVICGLLTFFNFIFSGYTFIMSDGNAKSVETVRNRLTYSILGLVLIVSSYTIIALISLIIFGNASYILNPTITSPGVGTP